MSSTVNEVPPEEQYLVVPFDKISSQALDSLVEEFILREGTDYGHSDVSLEQKKNRIFQQLVSGHICVVYSSLTENTTLLSRTQLQSLKSSS